MTAVGRLTDARRAEIERHAQVGGNASAAMVRELLDEIDTLSAAPITPEALAQALDDTMPRMAYLMYGQYYTENPDWDLQDYYRRVADAVLEEVES